MSPNPLPAVRAMSTVAIHGDQQDDTPAPLPSLLPITSPYPFAAAPDIIRAAQKDAYFAGSLANTLDDLVLRFAGGRTAHAWAQETRTAAEGLYWGLTSWLGSRTLGEEYCDLVMVQGTEETTPVASPLRRAAYVLSTVLAPYLAGKTLPSVRRVLRRRLEARVAQGGRLLPVWRYLLEHLDSLTSGTHARAATLALFYFYGAYYTLTTRLLKLRYVFTRRREAHGANTDDVVGYEVLGALLVLQLGVQGWMHVREVAGGRKTEAAVQSQINRREVSLDHDHTYTANNELLLSSSTAPTSVAALTNTPDTPLDPVTGDPGWRFDLESPTKMRWLGSRAARQCTLCLESLKDPAATPCGHVFCWRCIGDWVREKAECPLCRRAAAAQHILPLHSI